MTRRLLVLILLAAFMPAVDSLTLGSQERAHAVPLDAPLWHSAADAEVVSLVAGCFADDVARVGGRRPAVVSAAAGQLPVSGVVVVAGTLGKSHLIDDLVARGLITAGAVAGAWESTLVQVVPAPWPGVERALVVVGSDRRGTAYGLFDLSRRMGVSPWVWWADVPPTRQGRTWVGGREVLPSPAIRWRGIFINDERAGIRPWAARREPGLGGIGPDTYAHVAELMLRLKANLLWPAMHEGGKAFNAIPGNARTADAWAITMGSSHCEPLLRNNVDEWNPTTDGPWEWSKNRARMTAYWQTRVTTNAAYENFWTIGLRGIHDSHMEGAPTMADRVRSLEDVIGVQRTLLQAVPGQAPQMFVPYKEVLEVYEAGLKVPDDVTLVWPDDNYGYLRRLPTAAERARAGGNGIYHHMSYLGLPLSYIWLDSTPLVRLALQLDKARAWGADRLWMFNVGDIANCERSMSFVLDMAWKPQDPRFFDQRAWLESFAVEQFGAEVGPRYGALLDTFYRLVATCRPEHHRRSVPEDPLRDPATIATYQARWQALVADLRATPVPPGREAAVERLVAFPIEAAAAMATTWLTTDLATAQQSYAAWGRLRERYHAAAGGKWADMMGADHNLGLQRWANVFHAPDEKNRPTLVHLPPLTVLNLARADLRPSADGTRRWHVLEGDGDLPLLAQTDPTATPIADLDHLDQAPSLTLTVERPAAGPATLRLHALPTHAPAALHVQRVAVQIGDQGPVWLAYADHPENSKTWERTVVTNRMTATLALTLPAGATRLRITATEPTLVLAGADLAP